MEYKLRNSKGEEICVGISDWIAILLMAKENGWEPRGAVPPWKEDGIVGYALPIEQKIDIFDAQEFSEALKRGLLTIPNESCQSSILLFPTEDVLKENPEKQQQSILESLRMGTCQVVYVEGEGTLAIFLDSHVYFSGEGKRKIEEIINFCRDSSFVMDWSPEHQYDWGLILDEDYLSSAENSQGNFWLSGDNPEEDLQDRMWWQR